MLNLLVETKNEYTLQLIYILKLLIFEGFVSIYKQSLEVHKINPNSNDILKIFQDFLKGIPKWNQDIIDKETDRILSSTQSGGWLNDLIKATIKANIVVLMYNPTNKKQAPIDPKYYQNIKISHFIHKIYIECARELWNNPYLMYHNYPPIEIKRNQRDCLNIIKDGIKETIRKLLPVKHILKIYLAEDMEENDMDDLIERGMSEMEERNLKKLVEKDLKDDMKGGKYSTFDEKVLIESNSENKTIGSKILDILNKKPNIQMSDIAENVSDDITNESNSILKTNKNISNDDTVPSATSATSATSTAPSTTSIIQDTINIDNKKTIIKISSDKAISSSSENKIINKISDKLQNSETISELENTIREFSVKNKNNNLDDKVTSILKNQGNTDTDLETSLNYSQDDTDRYQEIFTNATMLKENNIKNPNKKLFNKYLKI